MKTKLKIPDAYFRDHPECKECLVQSMCIKIDVEERKSSYAMVVVTRRSCEKNLAGGKGETFLSSLGAVECGEISSYYMVKVGLDETLAGEGE